MGELGTEEKITRVNWEQSHNKWVKAVDLTKNHIRFCNKIGFLELDIVVMCGYCKQFGRSPGKKACKYCPLYIKGICYTNTSLISEERSILWQYVEEMQKSVKNPDNVDWDKALNLAIKIRDAIKKDEPE